MAGAVISQLQHQHSAVYFCRDLKRAAVFARADSVFDRIFDQRLQYQALQQLFERFIVSFSQPAA